MKKPTAKSVEEVNIYLEGLSLRIPDTSTDNAVARFDGTGGALQNSGVTIDDSNNVNITDSSDVALRVIASTGNPYLVRRAEDGSDLYDSWQSPTTTTRFQLRVTQTQWRLQRSESGTFDVLTAERTTGRVTIGAAGTTAGLEFGSSGPRMMVGTGSPEGAVTAPPGSVWRQTDDSTLTYLRWYKATGTGNTGWLPDFEGRFKTFTPTLKDSTGSTLSGWTCTGRYTIRGKWATCIVDILASSPSAGTGEYRIYLPSDAQAATSSPVRWCVEGSLIAFDNSSGNLGWMRVNVANAAYVTAWSPATWPYSNGQYQLSATVPNFTWAASDRINGTFSYEIA